MGKNEKIYQVKVTLKEVKPPIWRRLLVPARTDLFNLHKMIQAAMGWTNSHLHMYIINRVRYSIPYEDDWEPVNDERELTLVAAAPVEKKKFLYMYDFGDSWEHEVLVEKILPAEAGAVYPRCTAGKRACPPEDVGGSWGYEMMLEALGDPGHEEHEHWTSWMDHNFDAEAFDLRSTDEDVQNYQSVIDRSEF
jgi:hypothetical protein